MYIFLQIKALALQIGIIWTLLLTFTSLKLALNLVIFSIFSSNFTIKLWPGKWLFLIHVFYKSKVLLFLNPTSSNSLRLPCILTEKCKKFECKFFSTQAFFAPFSMYFITEILFIFSVKTHINLGLFGLIGFIKV